jgi:hypothetical protein
MAWRPYDQLIEGELDNTELGKVTGWMKFRGLRGKVIFNLVGNFHRDIRGAKIRLKGAGQSGGSGRMSGFQLNQSGNVGDITAGGPPVDYVDYPYIEWYSDENGRCVLELSRDQVEIIGKPIPVIESDPISRTEQHENLINFMTNLRF